MRCHPAAPLQLNWPSERPALAQVPTMRPACINPGPPVASSPPASPLGVPLAGKSAPARRARGLEQSGGHVQPWASVQQPWVPRPLSCKAGVTPTDPERRRNGRAIRGWSWEAESSQCNVPMAGLGAHRLPDQGGPLLHLVSACQLSQLDLIRVQGRRRGSTSTDFDDGWVGLFRALLGGTRGHGLPGRSSK